MPRYHWWFGGISGVVLLSYFIYHVHYLAFVRFDYGYNILANVTVGNVMCFVSFIVFYTSNEWTQNETSNINKNWERAV
jgi:succinate dehydrogenase hydrophobic anchor subunit